jgi:hypothetical protein
MTQTRASRIDAIEFESLWDPPIPCEERHVRQERQTELSTPVPCEWSVEAAVSSNLSGGGVTAGEPGLVRISRSGQIVVEGELAKFAADPDRVDEVHPQVARRHEPKSDLDLVVRVRDAGDDECVAPAFGGLEWQQGLRPVRPEDQARVVQLGDDAAIPMFELEATGLSAVSAVGHEDERPQFFFQPVRDRRRRWWDLTGDEGQ